MGGLRRLREGSKGGGNLCGFFFFDYHRLLWKRRRVGGDNPKCEEARKQTMAIGLKGQGGLIMRILRRQLMILVMVVLRMRL